MERIEIICAGGIVLLASLKLFDRLYHDYKLRNVKGKWVLDKSTNVVDYID